MEPIRFLKSKPRRIKILANGSEIQGFQYRILNGIKLREKPNLPRVMLERLEHRLSLPYMKHLRQKKSLKILYADYKPRPKCKKLLFNIVDKNTYLEKMKANKLKIKECNSDNFRLHREPRNNNSGFSVKELNNSSIKTTVKHPEVNVINGTKSHNGALTRSGTSSKHISKSNVSFLSCFSKHLSSRGTVDSAKMNVNDIRHSNLGSKLSNNTESRRSTTFKEKVEKVCSKNNYNNIHPGLSNGSHSIKSILSEGSYALKDHLIKPQNSTNEQKEQVVGSSAVSKSFKEDCAGEKEDTGIPKIVLYVKGSGSEKEYRCASKNNSNDIKEIKNSETLNKCSIVTDIKENCHESNLQIAKSLNDVCENGKQSDNQVVDPIEEKLKLLVQSNNNNESNREETNSNCNSKVLCDKETSKPTAHTELYGSEPNLRSKSRKAVGFYDENIPFIIESDQKTNRKFQETDLIEELIPEFSSESQSSHDSKVNKKCEERNMSKRLESNSCRKDKDTFDHKTEVKNNSSTALNSCEERTSLLNSFDNNQVKSKPVFHLPQRRLSIDSLLSAPKVETDTSKPSFHKRSFSLSDVHKRHIDDIEIEPLKKFKTIINTSSKTNNLFKKHWKTKVKQKIKKKQILNKQINQTKKFTSNVHSSKKSKQKKNEDIELVTVSQVIDSQQAKHQERDKGRRLAQEIPGFNWLEKKIRRSSTTSSSCNDQFLSSLAKPETSTTKAVTKPIPALIPTNEFIHNSNKKAEELERNGKRKEDVQPRIGQTTLEQTVAHLSNVAHPEEQVMNLKCASPKKDNIKLSNERAQRYPQTKVIAERLRSKSSTSRKMTIKVDTNTCSDSDKKALSKFGHLQTAVLPSAPLSRVLPKRNPVSASETLIALDTIVSTSATTSHTTSVISKEHHIRSTVNKSNELSSSPTADKGKDSNKSTVVKMFRDELDKKFIAHENFRTNPEKESSTLQEEDGADSSAVSQKLCYFTEAFKTKLNTSTKDINDSEKKPIKQPSEDVKSMKEKEAHVLENLPQSKSIPVSEEERPVLISIPEPPLPSFSSMLNDLKIGETSHSEQNENKDVVPSSLIAALYHELLRTRVEVEKLRKVQEQMLQTKREEKTNSESPSFKDNTKAAPSSEEESKSKNEADRNCVHVQDESSDYKFVYEIPESKKRRLSLDGLSLSPQKKSKALTNTGEVITIQYNLPDENKPKELLEDGNLRLRNLLGISNDELDVVPIEESLNFSKRSSPLQATEENPESASIVLDSKQDERKQGLLKSSEQPQSSKMQDCPSTSAISELPNLIPSSIASVRIQKPFESLESSNGRKVAIQQWHDRKVTNVRTNTHITANTDNENRAQHKLDLISVPEPKSLVSHHSIPILSQSQKVFDTHVTIDQRDEPISKDSRRRPTFHVHNDSQMATHNNSINSSIANREGVTGMQTFKPKVLIAPNINEHPTEINQQKMEKLLPSCSTSVSTENTSLVYDRNVSYGVSHNNYPFHPQIAPRLTEMYGVASKPMSSPTKKSSQLQHILQNTSNPNPHSHQALGHNALNNPANMRFSGHPAYHASQQVQQQIAPHPQNHSQQAQQHFTHIVQKQPREVQEPQLFNVSHTHSAHRLTQQRPPIMQKTSPVNLPPYNNSTSSRYPVPMPPSNHISPQTQRNLRNLALAQQSSQHQIIHQNHFSLSSSPPSVPNNAQFKLRLSPRTQQQLHSNSYSHQSNQGGFSNKISTSNENLTQGIYQNQQIDRTIIMEKADSTSTPPNKKKCFICPKSAQFLCSGCKTAWYCSKECQVKVCCTILSFSNYPICKKHYQPVANLN